MAHRKRGNRPQSDRRRSHPARLARRAQRSLAEVTGSQPETVTALERSDDETWKVTVELVELARLPETDDLIGSYQADIDDQGTLVGYRRLRRYPRNRSGPEQPADPEPQQPDGAEPQTDSRSP